MGAHTGKYGTVNGQTGLRTWSLNDTSAPKAIYHSASKGGPQRRPGITDWTGSMGLYGGKPLVLPGDAFAFAGYCAPSNGIKGANGDVYSGNAVIDQIVISWNYESGDVIAHTASFSGDGALTKGTGFYDDVVAPVYFASNELAGGTINGETISRITTVTLTLSAANKSRVDSSTAGGTRRESGNMDAVLAIAVNDTNADEFLVSKGDLAELQLPINPGGDFWWLKWMMFKEFTGITVNRETGDWIKATANFEFSGFDVAGAVGKIVLPGEEDAWWPAA